MDQHLRTLKISLVASLIGTLAWYFGLSNLVWPKHPFVAVLLITALSYYVVGYYWDAPTRRVAGKTSK
jgi:hypothetical protein